MKTALVIGATGQDGTYLCRLLLNKGYSVWGSSRDVENASLKNLIKLGIRDHVSMISVDPADYYSTIHGLELTMPDEIYHLGAQSSVGLSFEQPIGTIDSTIMGVLNLMESVRILNISSKIYHASSSECFGDNEDPINENSPFYPVSPYGVAKASASHAVRVFRKAYSMFCVNGLLFNHESPLRPNRFVTKKIVCAAYDIHKKGTGQLVLGDLDIYRDWGWAPEYVEAMHLMLQNENPQDYVIATGKTYSLRDFVKEAFSFFSLDYRNHVLNDPNLYRPCEIRKNSANPMRAKADLGWSAKNAMPEVVKQMCQAIVEESASD